MTACTLGLLTQDVTPPRRVVSPGSVQVELCQAKESSSGCGSKVQSCRVLQWGQMSRPQSRSLEQVNKYSIIFALAQVFHSAALY